MGRWRQRIRRDRRQLELYLLDPSKPTHTHTHIYEYIKKTHIQIQKYTETHHSVCHKSTLHYAFFFTLHPCQLPGNFYPPPHQKYIDIPILHVESRILRIITTYFFLSRPLIRPSPLSPSRFVILYIYYMYIFLSFPSSLPAATAAACIAAAESISSRVLRKSF